MLFAFKKLAGKRKKAVAGPNGRGQSDLTVSAWKVCRPRLIYVLSLTYSVKNVEQ